MTPDDEEEQSPSRRATIVAIIVIAAAVLAVILIVQRIHQMSAIQDCVMSGRSNCAPIATPAR